MTQQIGNYTFNEEDLLGQGSFAKVYKGNLAQNQNGSLLMGKPNKFVAIKKLSLKELQQKINQQTSTQLVERLIQEIQLMQDLDHLHITKYIDALRTEQNVYIIMEYCAGGDLEQYIYKNRPNEQKVLYLFSQIISAIRYMMQEKKIFHRDIKPSNILIHDDIPKICDFSISRKLDNLNNKFHTITGTPLFSSPQILKGDEYTSKSEVWSLGVTLYFMLFFKLKNEDNHAFDKGNISEQSFPWYGYNSTQICKAIKERPQVQFPSNIQVSEKVKNLIRSMLQSDEHDRISCEELFQHELFAQYDKNLQKAIKLNPQFSKSYDQFTLSQIPDEIMPDKVKEKIDIQLNMIHFIIQIIEAQIQVKDYCKEIYTDKKLLPHLLQGVLCYRVYQRLNTLLKYLSEQEDSPIFTYGFAGLQLYKQKQGDEFEKVLKQITKLTNVYSQNLQNIQNELDKLDQPIIKCPFLQINITFYQMIQQPSHQTQIIKDNIKYLFLRMREIHIRLIEKFTVNEEQLQYLRFLDDLIYFENMENQEYEYHQLKSTDIQKMLNTSHQKQMASPQSHYCRIISGFKNLFTS